MGTRFQTECVMIRESVLFHSHSQIMSLTILNVSTLNFRYFMKFSFMRIFESIIRRMRVLFWSSFSSSHIFSSIISLGCMLPPCPCIIFSHLYPFCPADRTILHYHLWNILVWSNFKKWKIIWKIVTGTGISLRLNLRFVRNW